MTSRSSGSLLLGSRAATAESPGIDPTLRLHLVGLVLCNVVFVHVTDVLSLRWLLPLYALTLATPAMVALQQRVVFRLAWNAAVLAIFTLLVHHASRAGVRFLLEDGLILAAFCQVHLLHNLGPRQRPDLLFFNSFLIALVTSFFCQATIYAAAFATYSVLLVAALVRASATSHGERPAGLLADAALKAAMALVVTTVLFLVLPRDFHREGLVADHLARVAAREVGFSEEVRLGRSEHTVATDRVAMKLKLTAGVPGDVPEHWRGATLVDYGHGRWRVNQPGEVTTLAETPWEQRRPGTWTKTGGTALARVEVDLADRHLGHVFAPLSTTMVALSRPADALVVPRADGTLLALPGASAPDGPLRYDIAVGGAAPKPSDEPPPPTRPDLRALVELPPGALPAAGRRLAESIAAQHPGAPQHELVEAIRRVLAAEFDYLPPGARGAAGDLGEFLSGQAGGHCEYFATALALMLRSRGVPCRLATGWLVHGWDYETGTCIVHAGDAHAWVEVLDPAGFWYAADATPPATVAVSSGDSLWTWTLQRLRATWEKVTGFDGTARDAALQWLAAAPGRATAWLAHHPFTTMALGAALVMAWLLRRRRRRPRVPEVVLAWQRAVARCGLQPQRQETPRELLARAAAAGVAGECAQELAAATRRHEQERYGGPSDPGGAAESQTGNRVAGTPYAG